MKFTLVFDGELKANGNSTKKQAIREKIHPQLAELWDEHPCLQALKRRRYFPTEGRMGRVYTDYHHSKTIAEIALPTVFRDGKESVVEHIDLCEPVIKKGLSFIPLVRERTALKCALKITFLRREEPGRVYQGGDLDNRLKTLLDALAVPQHDEQVVGNATPVYCLLEDDSLITGIDVQTHRLLARPDASVNDVQLLIEVDVRVTDPRGYNQMFLGDRRFGGTIVLNASSNLSQVSSIPSDRAAPMNCSDALCQ